MPGTVLLEASDRGEVSSSDGEAPRRWISSAIEFVIGMRPRPWALCRVGLISARDTTRRGFVVPLAQSKAEENPRLRNDTAARVWHGRDMKDLRSWWFTRRSRHAYGRSSACCRLSGMVKSCGGCSRTVRHGDSLEVERRASVMHSISCALRGPASFVSMRI